MAPTSGWCWAVTLGVDANGSTCLGRRSTPSPRRCAVDSGSRPETSVRSPCYGGTTGKSGSTRRGDGSRRRSGGRRPARQAEGSRSAARTTTRCRARPSQVGTTLSRPSQRREACRHRSARRRCPRTLRQWQCQWTTTPRSRGSCRRHGDRVAPDPLCRSSSVHRSLTRERSSDTGAFVLSGAPPRVPSCLLNGVARGQPHHTNHHHHHDHHHQRERHLFARVGPPTPRGPRWARAGAGEW